MTAGTTRNGSSKFGRFRRNRPEYSVLQNNDTISFRNDTPYSDDTSYVDDALYRDNDPYGAQSPVEADGAAWRDQEAAPPQHDKHYTGRHSSAQGKATRKRVGKVVPVVAAAAAIAAGTTAAYILASGGHPQSTHLNSAMAALPDTVTSASAVNAAKANAAAVQPLKIATGTASHAANAANAAHAAHAAHVAHAAAKAAAAARASHKSAPAPSVTATQAAATPAASSSAAAQSATGTLSCNLSVGMLPDNVTAIVSFLVAHGYSNNAAAGIAGNIYQESKGNPESIGSGGGGLIGWTPLPSGFVTGNVTADLQTQLDQLLVYNQGWSQYISTLNAAASPAAAASIYVTDFERAGIPAASTREASATNVASACGL